MIRIKRIQILSFWYIYDVYTDVGYKCQVMSIHVMAIIPSFLILSAQVCTCVVLSSHETPCQVMTNHVKSCHGDYPLISHIVSSGVHFVAIFPSFFILSAQVCTLWQFSPRFSYCQLRCAHVLSCQAMKRHVKS